MLNTIARFTLLVFIATVLLNSYVFSSEYAMISDRVVSQPDGVETDLESLRKIVVYEVLEVDGKVPQRRKARKSGDYPYVLVPEGRHRLKILKTRAFGPPNEKGELLELSVSVDAGLRYEIRGRKKEIELVEIED